MWIYFTEAVEVGCRGCSVQNLLSGPVGWQLRNEPKLQFKSKNHQLQNSLPLKSFQLIG